MTRTLILKQFLYERHWALPKIDRVIVASEDGTIELREARKWISGRFERNIGIDQATHGVGQSHAHVYGAKTKSLC
jgi:hypothetical protein